MTAGAEIVHGCGWEHTHEFGRHDTSESLSKMSIVTLPAHFPAGVTMPNQCLLYDDTAGGGGDSDFWPIPSGQAPIYGLSDYWSPHIDPTIVGGVSAMHYSVDNGSLGGVAMAVNASKNLALCAQGAATVYGAGSTVYNASDAKFYKRVFMWGYDGNKARLVVYGFDGAGNRIATPVETIEIDNAAVANMLGSTPHVRYGQLAGTSNAAWHSAGPMVTNTQYISPPLDDNWVQFFPTAGPGADNSTKWVPSDGSGDDSTNEYQQVDSVNTPGGDVSIQLTQTSFDVTEYQQYYDFANSLLPGGANPLYVIMQPRFFQFTTGTGSFGHESKRKLGSTQQAGILTGSKTSGGAASNGAWAYQRFVGSRKDPDGNDWTSGNIDSLKIGHEGVAIVSSGTGVINCDQLQGYLIYGPDNYIDLTPAGGRRVLVAA